MRKIICVSIAAVGLAVIGVGSSEARDGCGPGRYFNGRGCVSQYRAYAPRYYQPGYGSYARYGRGGYPYGHPYYPSCGHPGFTVQDGRCKPYRGPP